MVQAGRAVLAEDKAAPIARLGIVSDRVIVDDYEQLYRKLVAS